MFVCICRNVTERDIRRAVHHGATNFRHLQSELAVSTECGQCRKRAHDCLLTALAMSPTPEPLSA